MDLKEIVSTIIRGEQALKFPLKVNNGTWIADANGNHILDVRGYGYLQYNPEPGKGAEIQDAIGEWVVKTLNEEAARQGLITA